MSRFRYDFYLPAELHFWLINVESHCLWKRVHWFTIKGFYIEWTLQIIVLTQRVNCRLLIKYLLRKDFFCFYCFLLLLYGNNWTSYYPNLYFTRKKKLWLRQIDTESSRRFFQNRMLLFYYIFYIFWYFWYISRLMWLPVRGRRYTCMYNLYIRNI